MEKSLKDLGFGEVDPTVNPRLIMAIDGLEKSSKSHTALTAPAPTAYFNVDTGLEGVIHKFAHKEVYLFDMIVPDGEKEAKAEWERFTKAYFAMLKDPDIRTIVGDTATEWWELIRMARFGKTTQVMPYMYGPVNAEFRKLIKAAYASDKNLILLHKLGDVYVNNEPNGEYKRLGFKDTGYLVQMNCRVYRDDSYEDDDGNHVPGEFHLYVQDCRQNPDLAGQDFTAPFNQFSMLASLVLPSTEPGDWE